MKNESKDLPRTKSRGQVKKDFAVMEEEVIRCICANIVVFVLDSEKRGYNPPEAYHCFDDITSDRVDIEEEHLHGDTLLREVQSRFTEIHTETQSNGV